MKNYFYRIFLACILTSTFYAQQVNNTEFKTKTLQVFQNLDKNRIPHGILLDFGMEFTNLQAFNGTLTDSTYTSSQTITDIYKTLLMCRVRQVSTGFITPQEYATRWYTQREIGVMTLSGLFFKYNKFNDTAYPSKLNYSNNKFSDKFVGSVWQNPYDEKQLFAMTPAIPNFKGLDLKVKLPANLFLSNYPANIQNIQIDFSDGLGFRLVPYDQLINVSYTVANTYTWQYKITLTNGQTLLSYSKIVIEEGLDELTSSAQSATARVNANAKTSITGYEKVKITATTPYNGTYGSATLYIHYAYGGNTIQKPLIVAEGFDTGVILHPENEGGDNTINTFLNKVNFSNSIALYGELNSYDIIYVDWNVGVDFIKKNAYVLEEVIKYVNTKKGLAGSTTPNVVIGQSMGGLVARYALRDIELNRNFNHDTKLYISHDAPHLGANTPLSVQHSARHLRNLYISTPIPLIAGEIIMPMIFNFAEGFSETINAFGGNTTVDAPITPLRAFSLADVPAARQMQYTWVSNTGTIDNTIHDAWQQELSLLNYPQGYIGKPIRNIAISNGSECGITQIDNGNIMSYVKDAGRDTFLSNYIGIMDGVYGTSVNRPDIVTTALFPGKSYWEIDFQSKYMTTLNQSKNIYHGSIKYKKKIFWFIPITITVTNKDVNQPSGVLPYDIYGGGIHKTLNDQLPLTNIVSNGFGFIPTASALDIGKGTTVINDPEYRKSYVGALPPIAPTNSPFQNFISNFDANNPNNNNSKHISFNRINGDWLSAELIANENPGSSPVLANCTFMCSENSVSQITGNNGVCGTSVFSVPSGGDYYNWYISEGANLVNLAGNGTNSVTLSQVDTTSSGYVTLSLYYGASACGYATITKRILVGSPDFDVNTSASSAGYSSDYADYTLNLGITFPTELSFPISNMTVSDFKIGYVQGDVDLSPDVISNDYSSTYFMVKIPTYYFLYPEYYIYFAYNINYTNGCGETVTKYNNYATLYGPNSTYGTNSNLKTTANTNTFTIYPNPSSTTINVALFDETKAPAKKALITGKLYDLNNIEKRKVVIKDNSAQIDANGLIRGVYVLKIDIDGKVESHQVIVK